MRFLRVLLCLALVATAPSSLLQAEEAMQEIVINPGDTMWAISNRYLKDPQKWPEIVKHNKLPTSDPTMALPGTRIRLPVLLIKEEFRQAQIIRMTPEVRFKRKAETEWKTARSMMMLGYEDSLRTMKGGDARVRFPTREEVQINENSLVILKPEKFIQEVQLFEGDVRASRAKVIMPNGVVVKPRVTSDFHAKIRGDKTGVVFVYKGEVDVTSQGKTVRVPEGYGTTVPDQAPPSAPQPLPSFPDFDPMDLTAQAPGANLAVSKVSDVQREDSSSASRPPKAKSVASENLMVSYRIQMATDPKFSTVVLEKLDKIGQPFDIKKQKVADGTYFVRLAFIDAFGSQGGWSAPTQAVKDTVAPEVTNVTPENNQQYSGEESYCEVVGNVKGAALLTVNGELVFVTPAGRFAKYINLVPGSNKITVLARDTQGNETIVERKVEYRAAPVSKDQ